MSVHYEPSQTTKALAAINGRLVGCYVAPAHYAKGQMKIVCERDGSMMKTRAMRLCCALKGRWTNREKAYIFPVSKACRFVELYVAGWDAEFVTEELIPPEAVL